MLLFDKLCYLAGCVRSVSNQSKKTFFLTHIITWHFFSNISVTVNVILSLQEPFELRRLTVVSATSWQKYYIWAFFSHILHLFVFVHIFWFFFSILFSIFLLFSLLYFFFEFIIHRPKHAEIGQNISKNSLLKTKTGKHDRDFFKTFQT